VPASAAAVKQQSQIWLQVGLQRPFTSRHQCTRGSIASFAGAACSMVTTQHLRAVSGLQMEQTGLLPDKVGVSSYPMMQ